ncbi:MAG: RDD family protein [Candidatus Pseudobacter hemicellulosilyticus]|uniref:RDD family protein n=1 Tax=Candidatus Pseudobacter hemicellulosilyticus TaxID=3121375 RepID=A0AAJ5WKA7_9BACT|nr:MAG: RDD family protein [Pseudobacter sp.]
MLVKLDTGFNIEVEFPVAPFHLRLIAWFIDGVICTLYMILMNVLVLQTPGSWEWKTVLVSLPSLFYHLVCEIMLNGQSVGKLAMGIKVIAADGGHPSIGQYLIRWVFRLIDFPIWIFAFIGYEAWPWWTFPLLFAGLASVIISPRSQRIGDLLAGTLIIDVRARNTWQNTVFTEVEDSYKPTYPQVMQLSDRDINTLKSIIESIRRKGDPYLALRIADRIKSKLRIQSEQDSFEFLQALLKDYNYYSTH